MGLHQLNTEATWQEAPSPAATLTDAQARCEDDAGYLLVEDAFLVSLSVAQGQRPCLPRAPAVPEPADGPGRQFHVLEGGRPARTWSRRLGFTSSRPGPPSGRHLR